MAWLAPGLLLGVMTAASASGRHVQMGLVTSAIGDAQLDTLLAWLPAHRDALDIVSATAYRLELAEDGRTVTLGQWPTNASRSQDEITRSVHALGMSTLPFLWEDDSVSCMGGGRCLLARLRALAANATMRAGLVAQLARTCVQQRHAGFVLDFETHEAIASADLVTFATFARELGEALHAAGKLLSIGVSPGKPIYPMTALAASGADMLLDYGTYASDDVLFHSKLSAALEYVPASRLALGLKSRHSNFSASELSMRFDLAAKLRIPYLQVWVNQDPILPSWLPYLRAFMRGR